MPIPIFRFIGHSGVGKTTLLEAVIAEMTRRGLRVAVAKDTHHRIELDQPGKDTWRLARAGASQTVLASEGQLVLIQKRSSRPTLDEVAGLVERSADVLLAEGFRQGTQPAIVVCRSALGRALPEYSGPLCAAVSDAPLDLTVRTFGFDEVEALVDHLLATGAGDAEEA